MALALVLAFAFGEASLAQVSPAQMSPAQVLAAPVSLSAGAIASPPVRNPSAVVPPPTRDTPAPPPATTPVVIDLDIGDDIDDAFALAFVLATPAFDIRGIGTAWGDTALRARLVERLVRESGHAPVPVRAGIVTESRTVFSQARWADGPHRPGEGGSALAGVPGPGVPADGLPDTDVPHPSAPTDSLAAAAVEQLLAAARRDPGNVTLLALGPLTNVAAAVRRDPQAFRQLKQIVMMGGSVRAGYGQPEYGAPRPPDREYNIVSDPAAAQAVFAAGVPIVLMPLDSTVLKLDEIRRAALFRHGSTLTDALTLLYHQWTHAEQPWASPTPTLFDVVPVAWLLDPALCPTVPLRIDVEPDGMTRERPGPPNARVCLRVDKPAVLDRMMRALLR